ncbi:MAG: RNA methyltransferase [Bacteroidaceae bacterium]|nr:RNA methyltransferase [Bacteroidaceae bacterium]
MISKNRIKYIHSLELKKYRKADEVFVAEGWKVVGDLLSHFQPVYLAATAEWFDTNRENKRFFPAETDVVTEEELRRASLLETPQQVIALFRQRRHEVKLLDVAGKELCLMLDDVQNPGNLGTIVRLADWFGIEHVFCSQGCADIYNPKTVQATMGAMARVCVHYLSLEDALAQLNGAVPVYGTFLDGDSLYEKSLTSHGIIVMGNEGRGVSDGVARYVTERLLIPNYPPGRPTSESLNVAIATAVVCAEFRRETPP